MSAIAPTAAHPSMISRQTAGTSRWRVGKGTPPNRIEDIRSLQETHLPVMPLRPRSSLFPENHLKIYQVCSHPHFQEALKKLESPGTLDWLNFLTINDWIESTLCNSKKGYRHERDKTPLRGDLLIEMFPHLTLEQTNKLSHSQLVQIYKRTPDMFWKIFGDEGRAVHPVYRDFWKEVKAGRCFVG